MPMKTRLDSVVQLRERAEDHAKGSMREAAEAVRTSQLALTAARANARRLDISGASAAHWELRQVGHERALRQVEVAEHRMHSSFEEEATAKTKLRAAHQNAELVRRVVTQRQQAQRTEESRAEQKAMDEFVTLRQRVDPSER